MVSQASNRLSAAAGDSALTSGFTPGARPPRVRVLGTRLGRYIEFEYSVDEDLAVELVMPFAAFDEFCATQKAEVQGTADLSMEERHVLAARRPGLYRAPPPAADADAP